MTFKKMASTSKKRKIDETENSIESKHYEDFKLFVQTLVSTKVIDEYVELLQTRKEALQGAMDYERINEEIKKHGFAVRIDDNTWKIQNVSVIRVPYHVRISTCSRLKEDPADSATVDRSAYGDEQVKWVKATGFDKQTRWESGWDKENLSEKMEFENITKEWDYGDYDSPICGLGSVECRLYFATPPLPDKTRAFTLISEGGEVSEFKAGEFNETEDEWNEHVGYVVYK